ncbi:hypothetical protein VP01_997g2 [Puccinia sorghi]|uniref:Uncharacterized protein n=1 Tax=Puccinia sorghi TaxID=27349 RepID=A0A0L6U589_9BASI|nr:hypothetical protein VP01_997g2 [Puccinia sorghi]
MRRLADSASSQQFKFISTLMYACKLWWTGTKSHQNTSLPQNIFIIFLTKIIPQKIQCNNYIMWSSYFVFQSLSTQIYFPQFINSFSDFVKYISSVLRPSWLIGNWSEKFSNNLTCQVTKKFELMWWRKPSMHFTRGWGRELKCYNKFFNYRVQQTCKKEGADIFKNQKGYRCQNGLRIHSITVIFLACKILVAYSTSRYQEKCIFTLFNQFCLIPNNQTCPICIREEYILGVISSAIQLIIFCNLVETWLDVMLKEYQNFHQDKKNPLAIIGVSFMSFNKTQRQKLNTVALEDLKTGLGDCVRKRAHLPRTLVFLFVGGCLRDPPTN